jgi:hypothetical protein
MQEREIRQAQSGENAEDFPRCTKITTRRGEPWFAREGLFYASAGENKPPRHEDAKEARRKDNMVIALDNSPVRNPSFVLFENQFLGAFFVPLSLGG